MKHTELQRLKTLREFRILDTGSEKVFDDITKLIAQICDTKIALISFVDENRQWFKSRVGLDVCETPRDIAFCHVAIQQDDILIIEDTQEDDRFKNNPLVTGDLGLRFYAGAVLKSQEGFNIGTLCIADTKPRKLNAVAIETLRSLASLVMTQIELRRKTEDLNLEKAKARHREELLNALPDFAVTCDLDGFILTYNSTFDEACRKEDKKNIFDYYPLWAKKQIEEICIPHSLQHGMWRGESAILKKNGEELHVYQTIICHRDTKGFPKFFSTVIQDISQTETSLRKFETLTKLAPVGIFMTNAKGVPNFFNDHWYKIAGMTRDQAMADNGFGSFSAFHEDDLDRVVESWFNATQERREFNEEYRMRNKQTGKVHYIRSTALPLKNTRGEITGYIGSNLDLSEEKEMASKLSSSVKQLKSFIMNLPAAVAMFDKDIKYIAASRRWIQDYGLNKIGFNETNIIGKSHYDVFPNLKAEYLQDHQDALNGIGKKKDDDHFVRDDGSEEWLNWDVRPWFNEKNEIGGIMMLTEVITSKKLADLEVQKAKTIAEKASEAKSVFLANMSHEMRTPLNSIIGLSDLISHSHLEAEQAQQIQVIHKSGEVLKNLIDDIIDLTKIESGKVTLQKIPVNFHELTEKIVQIFSFEAMKKNIELKFQVEKQLPIYEGDPVRITQIMIKLLGNAIKYTPKGLVTISVSQDQTDPANILFSVMDTGIGIDPSIQEIIFEKFTQAENATVKQYGGTGLGLAITKNLVQMMNGKIWVKSEPGKGSDFRFTLRLKPLKQIQNDITLTSISEIDRKLRILVVDDSIDNRNLILAYLKKYPFEVETAENGLEALNLMKSNRYDFVFMDIQMPVMDGLTATKSYREWESVNTKVHVPIAALTAFALQEDHAKSLNAGCDLHLTKPVKKLTIIEAIKELTKQQSP